MNDNLIELRRFTKDFGTKRAVDALNLSVARGSIFGFLGANGAGKTTTIRGIMGHLRPTEGEVIVLGEDPWKYTEADRRAVAYVSENMNLPPWMTGRQAIRYCESLYPDWDSLLAAKLTDEFEISKDARFRTLSKGQKRRLCILLVLCQNAELLVMDEPSSGLDVSARHGFLEHVLDLVCDGNRTVFLSSHILSDLERVVDRIGIISKGRLILEGELEHLKSSVRKVTIPGDIPLEVFTERFRVLRHEISQGLTSVTLLDFDEEKYRSLSANLPEFEKSRTVGLNLEDLFVEIDRFGCLRESEAKEERS